MIMSNITIKNGRVIHPRVIIQTMSVGINLRAERQLSAIDRIVNHHPVSGEMPTMSAINSWWVGSGRNWDRSGYHFIILGDGQIWQLCHLLVPAWGAGAAANGRGIQISIAGNFSPTKSPSRAAQDAYGWLVNQLLNSAQLPNLNHINHVTRHSDWMATSCSGYTTAQAHSWINRAKETPAQSVSSVTHTVVCGDNLNQIARNHNTTVAELARINNIANPNVIRVGQVLNLPIPKGVNSNRHQLIRATPGFMTADDARINRNPRTIVNPGTYYIFNRSQGMINVTRIKGKPGSWINPS